MAEEVGGLLNPLSCLKYENPSTWNTAFAIFLAIGVVGSYVPQHVRVIRRKSSEGISPWFLLLGIMSGVCATCNVWLLGKPIYHCCKIITRGECFAAVTGIIQITCQAASAALILVLVLIFARSQPFESPDEFAKIKLVGQISLVCTLGSFLLSLSVYSVKPHLIDAVANFFGLTAAFLAVTQYFPQIYTTFTLKHAGTFSIPMMCIQTPGGYLWTWSLAQTTKWSTWLPYLTTAILQNVLLVLAVYYEWQNAKKLQRLAPELHQQATETDALLPSNIRRHTD